MTNSSKTNLIDKTIANIWKAWDELSSSTAHYISGKPRPDLPQDDLIKVMAEVADCIKGKSDEASLRARAAAIGKTYLELNEDGRSKFLRALAADFDVDRQLVDEKIELVKSSLDNKIFRLRAEEELKIALQPTWRVLLGRFTTLPDGVKFLVDMRTEMLSLVKTYPEIKILSNDLRSMLSAWFDIGLLELVQINWGSPASLLEKLIAYESVHAIRSWSDLKNRLGPDRRCFGFFHPNMPHEPLIFVQVALVEGISNNIDDLLDESKSNNDSIKADTAVFYSISNAQRGLDGISFGNFLIKTVVEKLSIETPNLRTFATLSPIPGFRDWFTTLDEGVIQNILGKIPYSTVSFLRSSSLKVGDGRIVSNKKAIIKLVAHYLMNEKNKKDLPINDVCRFHLGNGAIIEDIVINANVSEVGFNRSFGVMVNYLYELKNIEKNHEDYVNNKNIIISDKLKKLI